MNRLTLSLIAIAILASVSLIAYASVDDAPPVVVKTFPESGAKNVDPAKVTEIRVTFSKKMTDKSWSWSSDTSVGEELPGTGAPHYLADGRTCVLPVKLVAGRSYATWLNSSNFHGFKDVGGNAAVPYLLTFKTKD